LIIPLILLSFPGQRGLWLVLVLSAIVFVEWPLADALHSAGLLAIAILARTALFIALAVLTARQLWPARKTPEAVSTSGV
jgi:glucose-6-phosphate-specific signal transduction histidine kinase